jgi:hypothetical protein
MGVAPQTLSQALNQRRRQSLTEYLAERRMREAMQLLLDPANDCYTSKVWRGSRICGAVRLL